MRRASHADHRASVLAAPPRPSADAASSRFCTAGNAPRVEGGRADRGEQRPAAVRRRPRRSPGTSSKWSASHWRASSSGVVADRGCAGRGGRSTSPGGRRGRAGGGRRGRARRRTRTAGGWPAVAWLASSSSVSTVSSSIGSDRSRRTGRLRPHHRGDRRVERDRRTCGSARVIAQRTETLRASRLRLSLRQSAR